MSTSVTDPAAEPCPLCPPSGPPTPRSIPSDTVKPEPRSGADHSRTNGSVSASSEEGPDKFYWIGCTRCSTWFHSICVLLGEHEVRATVPDVVMEEIKRNYPEDDVWFDWTKWMNRWYCSDCLEGSAHPAVESKSHHPLAPTLKRGCPPFLKPRASPFVKKTRSPSASSTLGPRSSPPKRRKLDPSPPSDVTAEHDPEALQNPSAPSSRPEDAKPATHRSESPSANSRPKREASKNRPDYRALHNHIPTPTARWLHLIHDPKNPLQIVDGHVPRLRGSMVSKAWVESSFSISDGPDEPAAGPSRPANHSSHPSPELFFGPAREPLLIKEEDGGFTSLGGQLPGKDFTVHDVAELVGLTTEIPVIDVATQQSSIWSLAKWAEYLKTRKAPGEPPDRVYNVISLEITGTELAKRVRPPKLVSEIDWVDNCWNFGPGGKAAMTSADPKRQAGIKRDPKVNGHATTNGCASVDPTQDTESLMSPPPAPKGKAVYPKVQLYCLMGMQGAWTDWHVDFAASSVYYTIHTGAKTFFFIRPSEKNLAAYAEWSGSYERQQSTWLGDMCDEVRKVTLTAGDTMFIPAGYIHAVYTPLDSIVFGGNFVHSYDIPTQLRLRQIEIDTKVPQMFRFPHFDRLCWYVGNRYCSELRLLRAYRLQNEAPGSAPHPRVLEGLLQLATFLIEQADIMEDASIEPKKRKLVHDRLPAEAVKDASALARELLWRVKRELPTRTEKPIEISQSRAAETAKPQAVSHKKRPNPLSMLPPASRTSDFSPPPWSVHQSAVQHGERRLPLPRPTRGHAETNGSTLGEDEEALDATIGWTQRRTRIRHLFDGRTIQEETTHVTTEKRITWEASVQPTAMGIIKPAEDGGVKNTDG